MRQHCCLSSCEHGWISLRAQRDMFRRQHCCVLTPGAHLELSPCARKHVPAKRLLRSHAGSTLGSLSVRKQTCSCDNLLHSNAVSTVGPLSVRKKTCSIEKTAAISRCPPPEIDDFYLRTDPVSTIKRAHVPYAIGNP